jgi:hypothetical protein
MTRTRFVRLTVDDKTHECIGPIDSTLVAIHTIDAIWTHHDGTTLVECNAGVLRVRESPAEILAAIAEAEGASDAPEVPDSGVVMLAVAAMRRDAEQYGGRTHDALVVVANWLERLAEGGG